MAHGFVSYSKPNSDLNLPSLIAGKVKDSFGMAAEERKAREKEIAELSNKEELTDEETKRLEFLKEQDSARKEPGLKGFKNSFFAKSLMAQFGGDRKRRLEGTFSKNPRASQDPTLTKEERFSALLDEASKPAEEPVAPAPVDDLGPMDYGDANAQAPTPQQTTLDKILSKVSSSYDMISAKLSALQAEEKKSVSKKEETNSKLSRFTKVFKSISDYFDIDNDLKKIEGDIEKEKLNNFKESQADAKASAESDAIKGGEDLSNFEEDLGRPDEKNMVGDLLKSFLNPMNLFKLFRGGGKAGGGKTPGITPTSKAYSAPIGPQPMNSPTPWAAKGAGDRGGMFGSGGFTPRMPAKKLSAGGIVPRKPTKPTKKLAGGGVYDNPTTTRLNPGDSVVPLNRNNALADVFKQSGSTAGDKGVTGPMGEVLQLPTKVAGGLVLTKMSQVFEGVSSFLKPVITPIMNAVGPAFGLPSTIIAGLFGGAPAAAATLPFNFDAFTGKKASKKSGRGSGSSSGTPTPPPTIGGADLGATMREGETIQAQDPNGPGGFIQGGSGRGGENYDDGGYAIHYHLTPPSADEAGLAQSRSIAFTAATMMLDRGSSVYFGNIKEDARREDLADQIAREQVAHTQPRRTYGGIDMQEKSSSGSMNLKFPLKVTNMGGSKQGGSGRTARIVGTNVTLAHGAIGSANSIETASSPTTTSGTTPVALGPDTRSGGSNGGGIRPAARPAAPGASPQTGATGSVTIPAIFQTQPKPPPGGVPLSTPMAFSLTNPSPGYTSLYGPLQF